MTRIVLEEVFKDAFDPETGDPIKVKIGEIIIHTEDLTPDFIDAIKTGPINVIGWKGDWLEVLRREGFDV